MTRRVADRLTKGAARLNAVIAPPTGITEVGIPMRDGTTLAADIYLPKASSLPTPAVVCVNNGYRTLTPDYEASDRQASLAVSLSQLIKRVRRAVHAAHHGRTHEQNSVGDGGDGAMPDDDVATSRSRHRVVLEAMGGKRIL